MVTCSCRSKGILAAGLVLVFGLAACDLGDEAMDVSGVHPILNFPTAVGDPTTLPGGSVVTAVGIGGFDLVVADGFSRSNVPFTTYPPFFGGCCYLWGSTAEDDQGGIDTRALGTADNDARKPPLSLSGALSQDFMFIAFPGVFNADYDFFGQFCCATPGATYVVGLERMAIQVNGELDAAAVLLGQPIAEPDSLFPIGGALGGDHTRAADLFNAGAPYFAEAGANPFIFGFVSATATGQVTTDAVFTATDAGGATVWMTDATPDQPLSPSCSRHLPQRQLRSRRCRDQRP